MLYLALWARKKKKKRVSIQISDEEREIQDEGREMDERREGSKRTSLSPPRLPNFMLEPSWGMEGGGRPPPLAEGSGMGEGDCEGVATRGPPGMGMGAEAVWCGRLCTPAGDSWKPNCGMAAALGPLTGPPLAMKLLEVMVTEPLRLWSGEAPLRAAELPWATAGAGATTAGTAGMIAGLLPFIGDTDDDLAWCGAEGATEPTTRGGWCDPVAITGVVVAVAARDFRLAPAAEAYVVTVAEEAGVGIGAAVVCWLAVEVISDVVVRWWEKRGGHTATAGKGGERGS